MSRAWVRKPASPMNRDLVLPINIPFPPLAL